MITPHGDLRGDGATGLRRTLAGELTGTPEIVILDLSHVEHIDADGVDALQSIAGLASEEGIRFCLVVPPNGALRGCPKVVEVTMEMPTFTSTADALRHHHDETDHV